MHLDLNRISTESTVALDLVPWLRPIETFQQLGRKRAPWHLWLDKWSYFWAIRCDRAADHWQERVKRADDKDQKRLLRDKADCIPSGKTAALAVSVALANDGRLSEHCQRTHAWLASLKRQHGARFGVVELVAESRLLLHLGRANVLENVGLYAERTTGLPIIPGTALKGVVSTWACWANHFNPADGSFLEITEASRQRGNFTAAEARLAGRILGDDAPTGSEHAGEVGFVGGFPLSPPTLGLDIVNPHHDSHGGEQTRLTPNAFLCVEPGGSWRFVFFVRPGAPEPDVLVAQTKTWIQEALTQTGIGAKTAAGYGRFRRPTDADLAAQQQQEGEAAAAQAAAARQAKAEAARAQQHATAHAALQSDYSNDASFKNRVLDKLNPSQLDRLQPEVALLQKPENGARLEQLKTVLTSKDNKDIRKRLRGKDWFPQDWLPAQ